MSSTSLAPSSDPPARIAKPAVRRTYGRARPVSPPPTNDESSSSTNFESPSKSLLNRWSNVNTSWRDSLALLDTNATSSDPSNADEEDEEAIKRAMEKLRREARGGATQSTKTIEQSPKSATNNLTIPRTGLGVTFSSSSLTSLPTTSPPPSSPPITHTTKQKPALQAQSSEIEETLFPVRKSGVGHGNASGKPRRIVLLDEESDTDHEQDKTRSTPSRPSRISASASPSPTPTPTPTPKAKRKPRLDSTDRSASPASDAGTDKADIEPEQDLAAFVRDLNAQEDAEEDSASLSGSGPNGLFDDEIENTPQPTKKGKTKGLNKKELAEMQKDIARAKREQPIYYTKPEPDRMPISTWVHMASEAIKQKKKQQGPILNKRDVPGLTFGHGSPRTSPLHDTPPDEITSFTPSSAPRPMAATTSKIYVVDAVSSSPTPMTGRSKGKGKAVIPASSEGYEEAEADDNEEQDFSSFMVEEKKQDEIAERRKENMRRLAEFKAAQLKQQRQPAKMMQPEDKVGSDDEFDVMDRSPVKQKTVKSVTIAPMALARKVPDAKAILAKSSNIPAISKQRQQMLQRAGKTARPKRDEGAEISETYIDFAGKAFHHSELKRINGGAKPAGQKQGRDLTISQFDVDKAMKMKHQQQIAALQKKKEEDWGRARKLPEKMEHDYEALIDLTKRSVPDKEENEAEDEDEEDDDFVPQDQEDMVYSGEESAAEQDEDEEEQSDIEQEAVAEAEEAKSSATVDEDEEAAPIIRRKPKTTRVAFDSDDEDIPTALVVSASAPAPSARQEVAPPSGLADETASAVDNAGFGFGEDIDLGGFGDGSQGFSQLFDATQINTGEAQSQDGFAQMRAQEPVGLLPANFMLPQVQISATQAERDNALIAGEIEEAEMARITDLDQPKKQYLNEKGLFTQTRPADLPTQTQMQMSDDEDQSQLFGSRRNLAGRSDSSLLGFDNDIQTQSQNQSQRPDDVLLSPTQGEPSFTRLRRRVSVDEDEEDLTLSPTQAGPSNSNAFDRLMSAAQRPQLVPGDKGKKRRSNLVDEQAEESDEDNGWGPLGGVDGEAEEDDDEEDGYVEGLVDDQVVNQEEKRKQDELAAEKAREIAAADDARREAEAKKITEGQYRTKRKGGIDFYSDDEDDDELRPKRLSKKQRRKRMLGREDGLDKLEGEANVFKLAYEEDLESDVEDDDDDQNPLSPIFQSRRIALSPEPEYEQKREEDVQVAKRTMKEKFDMLRQRARMNRGLDLDADEETQRLDREIGFDEGTQGVQGKTLLGKKRSWTRHDTEIDIDDDVMNGGKETGYSISRIMRSAASSTIVVGQDVEVPTSRLLAKSTTRSLASYAQYVQEESQTNRRVGGAGGVSVVHPSASTSATGRGSFSAPGTGTGTGTGNGGRPAPVPHPHRQNTASSSGSASASGSILLSKGNKFA